MNESLSSNTPARTEQKAHVRAVLTAKLAEFLRTQDEVINPRHPLAEYGIDSTDLLMLVFEFERQFGCRFPPSTFFEIETLDDLTERITASLTEQGIYIPDGAQS